MTFKEYYDNEYPQYEGKYGNNGEILSDVVERIMNLVGPYIDNTIEKKLNEISLR